MQVDFLNKVENLVAKKENAYYEHSFHLQHSFQSLLLEMRQNAYVCRKGLESLFIHDTRRIVSRNKMASLRRCHLYFLLSNALCLCCDWKPFREPDNCQVE